MHQLRVPTRGQGVYEITAQVEDWLERQQISTGLVTLFIQHTSASLLIQENADPDVVRDLENYLARLVPENDPHYQHTIEGADDMPGHIKSALMNTQLSVPVARGRLVLGTWQGIYVFEHRSSPHTRSVVLHVIGE